MNVRHSYGKNRIKNSVTQILHYNTVHFPRYAQFRYGKYLFVNIQNQLNTLKSSLLYKKNRNFTGK